jgi:hypothetical protein
MSIIKFKKRSKPPKPAAGRTQIYVDSADAHLKQMDEDGEVKDLTLFYLPVTITKNIIVEVPTDSEDITWFSPPVDITLRSVWALVMGSATPSVTVNPKFGADRSQDGVNILSSATAVTNTTSGQQLDVENRNIEAFYWVWLETSAKSGTVSELSISLSYTED